MDRDIVMSSAGGTPRQPKHRVVVGILDSESGNA